MIKLYFKKLLSMLLYAGIWILVFFIGYGAFATAANFFKFNIVRYSILIGIPAIIILAIVYNHRKEKTEIISFATIVVPFLIPIGIANPAKWWINIFAGIIVLCTIVAVFFIVDFILWEVVHIKRRKDYKI